MKRKDFIYELEKRDTQIINQIEIALEFIEEKKPFDAAFTLKEIMKELEE